MDCSDEQCHLMVQAMESWFVADPDKLRQYYGQGFNQNALPGNPIVEEIDRHRLEAALRDAIRNLHNTRKRRYDKIEHARDLLQSVDVAKVRLAAPHCDRLFEVLNRKIDEQP